MMMIIMMMDFQNSYLQCDDDVLNLKSYIIYFSLIMIIAIDIIDKNNDIDININNMNNI
jgi:hypothetical protein